MILTVPAPLRSDITTCTLECLPSAVTANITVNGDAVPLDLTMSVRVVYGDDMYTHEEVVRLPLIIAGSLVPASNASAPPPASGKALYRVRGGRSSIT